MTLLGCCGEEEVTEEPNEHLRHPLFKMRIKKIKILNINCWLSRTGI